MGKPFKKILERGTYILCLDHLQVSGLDLDPQGTIFSILDPDTDRIRIKVNIQELNRLKMEPWRAVDANNGGVEAQIRHHW
jgi:hypothetical protein